jgi:UDP-N-acetylglucosamine 3-dehydrogenase
VSEATPTALTGGPDTRAKVPATPRTGPGFAFLGCGQATQMHSQTIRKLRRDVGLFYASRDAGRARSFQRRFEGDGAFSSYAEALADERVNVAVVVTPPSSHLELTLAALAAGKHVIVEKPAFVRSSDFNAVEEAARAAGRQVLVAENYLYKPLADGLRRLFREEPLGPVLFLQVNALKTQKVSGWRADPILAGGGALLEGGIHWISLLAHLGPRVISVRAAIPKRSVVPERSIVVTLQYDDGALATLAYSWEVPSLPGGLRISRVYCSEGTATFESNGVFLATTGRRWSFGFPGLRDLLGYQAMFRDFLECVKTGRPPRFGLADARRDVEIVEEAYRSAGVGA